MGDAEEDIRQYFFDIDSNSEVEKGVFKWLKWRVSNKRNIFSMFLVKLSDIRKEVIEDEQNRNLYLESLKNSGMKVLDLDYAIKSLEEIANDYGGNNLKM